MQVFPLLVSIIQTSAISTKFRHFWQTISIAEVQCFPHFLQIQILPEFLTCHRKCRINLSKERGGNHFSRNPNTLKLQALEWEYIFPRFDGIGLRAMEFGI